MSLNRQQFDSIMRHYEQIRDANRYEEEQRRAEVYAKIPSLEDFDWQIRELALQRTHLLLSDAEAPSETLHESIQTISARRKAALKNAGFPENYLEPLYNCPDCHDTGYILTEEQTRQKCHCFRAREIAVLYEQSNIQEVVARENFATLSYEYYEGEDLALFERAVNICQNFVQKFVHDYQNLFFYGTVGTGKSFLSGCVAEELLKKGHSVIYFSASGLFEHLARYTFDVKTKETLYNFYEDLYNCELVIIDDLGTEMTNSFVASQLFALLNERHLRQKSTVISTNLNLEELRDRYSDRVFSRITSNYALCKLTGPDIRMMKKRAALN